MRLLILGAGYVGSRLKLSHPEAFATRRTPGAGAGEQRFDLLDETTWSALPAVDAVVWTFPAVPQHLALKLRAGPLRDAQLIVLGSTSAYLQTFADQPVDEGTPLDLTQERVAAEEALRLTGATILNLAGIWGPARDPLQWLKGGRIKSGSKFVNLAHVDDILATIDAVLQKPRPGERINVCDGEPRRWSEHVVLLKAAGRLDPAFALEDGLGDLASKRVRNDRLRSVLPAGYRFTRLT